MLNRSGKLPAPSHGVEPLRGRLAHRARVRAALRERFDGAGFIEVDTPILSLEVLPEAHIDPIPVAVDGGDAPLQWLQASPEALMKRLLAEGSGAIYQFARSFRAGERGALHDVEFVLLEWYSPGATLDSTAPLLATICRDVLGTEGLERLSCRDAFRLHAGIDLLARGGGAPPPPRPATAIVTTPPKPGEVSFAAEVAPLLANHCLGCHGGNETEANFSMASLASLLRGGRTGPSVVAGKGAESLLVKKLRGAGIEGQRMPLNKTPLPDADIALIEKWITEGARLDLLTGATPLDNVVAAGLTKRLSDGELAKLRSSAGEKLWRRAIPDEEPVVAFREGVCVIGNLPAARMATFADAAETVTGGARGELGNAGPLLKGGVVLYAVKQAFDYSTIWQNVVGSERPKGISSHAGVVGEVVYGAMLAPAMESEDDLEAAIAEVVAAAAFAGRNVPAWFSRGVGRAVAARLFPKSALVLQWKRDSVSAVSRLGSAADFFAGHSEPAATALAAGGFVGSIAGGNKLAQMLAMLDEGTPFDDAFVAVFKSTPVQAFEKWAARASR